MFPFKSSDESVHLIFEGPLWIANLFFYHLKMTLERCSLLVLSMHHSQDVSKYNFDEKHLSTGNDFRIVCSIFLSVHILLQVYTKLRANCLSMPAQLLSKACLRQEKFPVRSIRRICSDQLQFHFFGFNSQVKTHRYAPLTSTNASALNAPFLSGYIVPFTSW